MTRILGTCVIFSNDMNIVLGVPVMAQWLMNLIRNHEVVGSIPVG